jgi:hypothetical protein
MSRQRKAKAKENRTTYLQVRVTVKEKNRIKGLVRLNGYENMSKYILQALDEWRPLYRINK